MEDDKRDPVDASTEILAAIRTHKRRAIESIELAQAARQKSIESFATAAQHEFASQSLFAILKKLGDGCPANIDDIPAASDTELAGALIEERKRS